MAGALEKLEQRVAAAADLIAGLRVRVSLIEADLVSPAPPCEPPAPAPDRALLEEVATLRAERVVVRERIRGLIAEIDKVTW